MLNLFARLLAKLVVKTIAGVFVFLGTLGLLSIREVFYNKLMLFFISVLFMLIGGVIYWLSSKK